MNEGPPLFPAPVEGCHNEGTQRPRSAGAGPNRAARLPPPRINIAPAAAPAKGTAHREAKAALRREALVGTRDSAHFSRCAATLGPPHRSVRFASLFNLRDGQPAKLPPRPMARGLLKTTNQGRSRQLFVLCVGRQ